MPRLVEDAGGELSAGNVFKRQRHLWAVRGTDTLAGRAVEWSVTTAGIAVHHPSATAGGEPVAYAVAVLVTRLPSGGGRRWWKCPTCGRRCDSLFLPTGRDMLGCRTCCGLRYGSQYARGPVAERKARPAVTQETETSWWAGDRATGRLRLVKHTHTVRRL